MSLPSTVIWSTAGSTCRPTVAVTPLTATRPAITICSAARRDATPASASALWTRTRSLIEPQGGLRFERRELVERRQTEPLQEIKAGPIQERPTDRIRPALLDHQPAVEQAAQHIVGVDTADALDDGARHRLAVGDDRQRLESSRRKAAAVGADVTRDEPPGLGRGDELHVL